MSAIDEIRLTLRFPGVDRVLYERIEKLAGRERRSINQQILLLLTEALAARESAAAAETGRDT